jgi:hypothetical protein
MHPRTRSLLIAIVIVAVSMIGALWLQETRRFPWLLFAVAIWSPTFLVAQLQGGHGAGGPGATSLTLVAAVLMWWALIEGVRLLLRPARSLRK